MGAFGDILRSKRQELGYSLDQVEEETKIRKYYIKALEEENFSVLPAKVYAIGFVRRYARFLSINEDEAVEWFKDMVYPEQEEVIDEAPLEEHRVHVNISWKSIAVGLIFLVLSIWIGKSLVGYISDQVREEKPRPSVVDNLPDTPRTDTKPKPKPDSASNVENPVQVDTSQSTPPATKPKQPEERPGGVPPQPPSPVTPPSTEPETPPATGKTTVNLRATDRSWVDVYVDGEHRYSGFMNPNEETGFEGSTITVNLGNAGGVQVTVDGKNLGYLGASGQRVNKSFTATP